MVGLPSTTLHAQGGARAVDTLSTQGLQPRQQQPTGIFASAPASTLRRCRRPGAPRHDRPLLAGVVVLHGQLLDLGVRQACRWRRVRVMGAARLLRGRACSRPAALKESQVRSPACRRRTNDGITGSGVGGAALADVDAAGRQGGAHALVAPVLALQGVEQGEGGARRGAEVEWAPLRRAREAAAAAACEAVPGRKAGSESRRSHWRV